MYVWGNTVRIRKKNATEFSLQTLLGGFCPPDVIIASGCTGENPDKF